MPDNRQPIDERNWRVLGLWIVLLLACSPAELGAHAILLHTEPVANQRLEASPERVLLIFNERVETVFNSLRVVDAEGHRWDRGEVRVEDGGDTVLVALPPLERGRYGVFWRITSLDGHQLQGQFGFGVGANPPTDDQLAAQLPKGDEAVPGWFFPLFRGIGLGALALWLGGVCFLAAVLLPAISLLPKSDKHLHFSHALRRSAIICCAAGVAFLGAEVLWLCGKTATFIGLPITQALSLSSLTAVLTTTRLGEWWAIRWLSAFLLLSLTARLLHRKLPEQQLGIGWLICCTLLAALLLATIAATGHARAVAKGTLLAQAADWIHLAATAIWIGGLVHFLLLLSPARQRDAQSIELLHWAAARFSQVAQCCVFALLPTGIYSSWLHVPSWSSFLSTDYGRVLSTKLGLVLLTLLVAYINWRRALPALNNYVKALENALRWGGRLRQLVQAEVVLGALIVALAAVLTNLPPAAAVAGGGPTDLRQRAGDYFVSLHLDPNKVGKNQALVTLQDTSGGNLSDARRITVYLRSLDMDMGLSTVEAQPAPNGNYQAEIFLSMAGRWKLSVEVTPARGDAFVAEFQITSAL
ncbi:MAG: CopD family protein [Acidobacteria bacterium]|nr:CopD family protein [Acidobacteriota bacterium]